MAHANVSDGDKDPLALIFDVETTGLFQPSFQADIRHPTTVSPDIVSICWHMDGAPSNYFILKTNTPSHPKALAVHKITPEIMAEQGKDPETVMRAFLHDVERADIIVGHNVRFDRKVVRAWLLKRGWAKELEMFEAKQPVCTMLGALEVWDFPRRKWPTLTELATKAGVKIDDSKTHNAQYDVDITKQCYHVMASITKKRRLDQTEGAKRPSSV